MGKRNILEHATTGIDKGRSYSGDYMQIAKEGEEVVFSWLQRRPNVVEVIDFRTLRPVHQADIDGALRLYEGQICLVEIKTDTWLGVLGNVLNEVLRINHYSEHVFAGYLGWTLRSPAKYLLYYAPKRNPPAIYKATFQQMRQVLQQYTKSHDVTMDLTEQNKPRFQEVRTDAGKTTYNILIPETEYIEVFTIFDLEAEKQ